jgi:hypothetical protein
MPNKNSIESEIDKVVGSLSPSICMDTRHDYWDKQAKLATKQLKYLIQREVKKGRVDELKHIMDNDMEAVYLNFDAEISPLTIKERIAELEKSDCLEELEG